MTDTTQTTTYISMTEVQRLREAGQSDAAAKLLRVILDAQPHHAEANFHLAAILAEKGRVQDATPYMERAAKATPEQPAVLDALAQLYSAAGRLKEAIDLYEKIIATTPRGPGTVYSLLRHGILLTQLGRLGDAADDFKWVTQISPDYAPGWHNLGNVMLRLKNRDGAVNAYRKALALEPENANVLYALGRALIQTGNYEESLESLKRALELSPERMRIVAYEILALRLAGRREEADKLEGLHELVKEANVTPPPGQGSAQEWNGVLSEAIVGHPALGKQQADEEGEPAHSILQDLMGRNATSALTALGEPLNAAFVEALLCMPDWPDHPALRSKPSKYRLSVWAEVVKGDACPPRHNSPRGRFTGLYFCAVPGSVAAEGSGHEGWIEFGGTAEDLPQPEASPTRLVRPEVGKLLVFPSYLHRRMLPFAGDDPLVMVAFNAEAYVRPVSARANFLGTLGKQGL